MHERSIVVRQPANAHRLVLLFHGVGSSAANLVSAGEAIAAACPDALVVSVDAPHASTLGSGREWFSVVGITEQDRPARIAQAMPLFRQSVAYWQQRSGIDAAHTALVGFSQGAIMSLEAARQAPALAGTIVSIAGRFAAVPESVAASTVFHFIHGAQDAVIPARHAVDTAEKLSRLGAPVTLDVIPGLGHGIDARAASILVERLKNGS